MRRLRRILLGRGISWDDFRLSPCRDGSGVVVGILLKLGYLEVIVLEVKTMGSFALVVAFDWHRINPVGLVWRWVLASQC